MNAGDARNRVSLDFDIVPRPPKVNQGFLEYRRKLLESHPHLRQMLHALATRLMAPILVSTELTVVFLVSLKPFRPGGVLATFINISADNLQRLKIFLGVLGWDYAAAVRWVADHVPSPWRNTLSASSSFF